ncbi:hypothetical protein C5B42_01625 [Candidatus Cerribacteria bacterium 'Amazon FNV 2010 28 9']|uniref:Uncharacterized protein n=1 Tax=Candidatus Cerribacteria bacterium 'Amazon FNV 2010 28 9' TaxID=2081795 RepID=A0A317JPQ9_9BACT|nr:MAG: hypothetical protein C5B42_01625 [Candidatus Cerribacteria bacterium 'Amazon FNV 2010 28 9']
MSEIQTKIHAYEDVITAFEWMRYYLPLPNKLEAQFYGSAMWFALDFAKAAGLTEDEIENAKLIGQYKGLERQNADKAITNVPNDQLQVIVSPWQSEEKATKPGNFLKRILRRE